jgi:hypothetical protein
MVIDFAPEERVDFAIQEKYISYSLLLLRG